MDDAVVLRAHRKVADAELLAIGGKRLHLLASDGVVDAFLLVAWRVVVGHSEDVVGAESLDAFIAKRVESLRTRHLVRIQTVDIKLCWPVLYILHDMHIPYLIK